MNFFRAGVRYIPARKKFIPSTSNVIFLVAIAPVFLKDLAAHIYKFKPLGIRGDLAINPVANDRADEVGGKVKLVGDHPFNIGKFNEGILKLQFLQRAACGCDGNLGAAEGTIDFSVDRGNGESKGKRDLFLGLIDKQRSGFVGLCKDVAIEPGSTQPKSGCNQWQG